jgi:hypothetical protein
MGAETVILELALVHGNLNGTTWVAVAQAKHAIKSI